MYNRLNTIRAPHTLKYNILSQLTSSPTRYSIVGLHPWISGGLSIGIAAVLLAFSISMLSPKVSPDPLAETYSMIDNPWAATTDDAMALLR
jgi:hypothetical protein